MFEEWNERGRHGDDLLRREVEVVDLISVGSAEFASRADFQPLLKEAALLVEG